MDSWEKGPLRGTDNTVLLHNRCGFNTFRQESLPAISHTSSLKVGLPFSLETDSSSHGCSREDMFRSCSMYREYWLFTSKSQEYQCLQSLKTNHSQPYRPPVLCGFRFFLTSTQCQNISVLEFTAVSYDDGVFPRWKKYVLQTITTPFK